MSLMRRDLTAAALPLIFLAFDRVLKIVALGTTDNGAARLLGTHFGLFINAGLAFSLFGEMFALIASLAAFAVFIFFLSFNHKKNKRFILENIFPVTLVILGGGSNIFDRLFYGGVVDYFFFFRSAINIADIMILAGLIIFIKKAKGGNYADAR
jgi:lipoprotein signal peptidase